MNTLHTRFLKLLPAAVLAHSLARGVRDDETQRGHSYAMSRAAWIFRPSGAGDGEAAAGSAHDHRPHGLALIVYAVSLPYLAISRTIELMRNPTQPGDIISMVAVPNTGVYWLASVGRSSPDGTAVRVLAATKRRPRSFRHEDLEPHDEPILLSPKEFRLAQPQFVWRGPTEFWSSEPYVLEV